VTSGAAWSRARARRGRRPRRRRSPRGRRSLPAATMRASVARDAPGRWPSTRSPALIADATNVPSRSSPSSSIRQEVSSPGARRIGPREQRLQAPSGQLHRSTPMSPAEIPPEQLQRRARQRDEDVRKLLVVEVAAERVGVGDRGGGPGASRRLGEGARRAHDVRMGVRVDQPRDDGGGVQCDGAEGRAGLIAHPCDSPLGDADVGRGEHAGEDVQYPFQPLRTRSAGALPSATCVRRWRASGAKCRRGGSRSMRVTVILS